MKRLAVYASENYIFPYHQTQHYNSPSSGINDDKTNTSQHLDTSRCWALALRCGKFLSVGGVVQHVRSRCPCSARCCTTNLGGYGRVVQHLHFVKLSTDQRLGPLLLTGRRWLMSAVDSGLSVQIQHALEHVTTMNRWGQLCLSHNGCQQTANKSYISTTTRCRWSVRSADSRTQIHSNAPTTTWPDFNLACSVEPQILSRNII